MNGSSKHDHQDHLVLHSPSARIVDRVAKQFKDLPELNPGRNDYRVLLTSGVLVRSLNVVGQLALDGAVELVSIDIDLTWD